MSATYVGKFWAVTSFVASIATAIGFYFPYWIRGYYVPPYGDENFPMYFGTFRRCSYLRLTSDKFVELVDGCGRYSNFEDIPSIWWQITTITVGTGVCISLVLSLTGLIALCITDVVTTNIARVAGLLQMAAGLLIGGGVAIYPNGWSSAEVRQACGGFSSPYVLGECSLCWAFYVTCVGGAAILLCATLTCHAFYQKHDHYRHVLVSYV
ncbi:hypothetical protein EGW08_021052 [Elysia chlorotica]|uniref:LHFPL tetraspan subfamily member 6 protein n=1 Tax=Elysia chlorotica TaxID=188477 RepID=A0A3S0Z7K0_ELYCH|nr:hypothetical protein EGW08_021052 [Elysia chlorotica]